jgi:hypothetical protein
MKVGLAAFCVAVNILGTGSAAAQTDSAEAEYQDIEVIGLKDAYLLTPKQLREAVDAFARHRVELAPNAQLTMKVFRYRLDPALKDLRLRLLADTSDAIPITLDDDGRFSLPPINYAAKVYTLQANRRVGNVRVRPFALSPGTTETDLRVGDLRLTCRVAWAIARQNVSLAAKGFVGILGSPCTSAKISAYFTTERPLASATVSFGKTIKPVTVGTNGSTFRYPGYDRSTPNDARLHLVYR